MIARLLNRAHRADVALAVITTLLTSVATYLSLRLWAADLRVPFLYLGDALPTGAHFKTVREEGWYEFQPLLGAPDGQTYNDFPTADNLHMAVARILAFVTPDWAVAMNIYFLLGFPLAALAALLFLRRVGVSRPLSAVFAVLYAIAPYHYLRGESHLWLASYYAVPLAALLVVLVLRGRPLWGWGSHGGRVRRALFSPTARTLVIVSLIASSSSYYAVFFLTLLGCTGLIVFLRDRSWQRFWGAALVGAATVAAMLVNMAPDLLFSWENGSNPAGLERSAGEAEFYALKFAQLVLPWSGHQIGILSHLRGLYDSGYVSLGEQPALGLVAALGFMASFVLVALVAVRVLRARQAPRLSSRLALATGISMVILVAFMFATLGGVSTLISVLTSSLRGWNRMSIMIAILSLAVIGLLLDAAIRRVRIARLSPRRGRALVAGALAAVLLIVGFVDQTPGDADANYETNAARYWSDDTFFGALEELLPNDAQVLVLPYIPFPESSSESGMLASEQLIPYLHSESIAWSNGGIKGRPPADWPIAAENYGFDAIAALAVVAGFDGILVFRQGYRDNGAAVEAALTETTGSAPLRDEQERYGFFDLRGYATDLELSTGSTESEEARARILSPVVAYAGPDFGHETLDDGTIQLANGDGSGTFTLANDSDEERLIDLTLTVVADAGSSATVTLPGELMRTLTFKDGSATITVRVTVPAGGASATVSVVDAAGSPADEVRLAQPSVSDPVVMAFLAGLLTRTP